jgi:hypothetical protein
MYPWIVKPEGLWLWQEKLFGEAYQINALFLYGYVVFFKRSCFAVVSVETGPVPLTDNSGCTKEFSGTIFSVLSTPGDVFFALFRKKNESRR